MLAILKVVPIERGPGDDPSTSNFVAVDNQETFYGSLFGGQLLGQAAAAAGATAPGRLLHSLHAYFLKPGRADRPVRYCVEHVREGRAFAHRRVTADQDGVIFTMNCVFRMGETGWHHQAAMPDVPPPEDLASIRDIVRIRDPGLAARIIGHFAGANPIDLRPIDADAALCRQSDTRRQAWLRIPSLSTCHDPIVHRAAMAWLSDFWISSAALIVHRHPLPGNDVLLASIDHALWFFGPVRADEWLLFDADSPVAAEGTGLSRSSIYDRRGRLVASVVQDILQRPME